MLHGRPRDSCRGGESEPRWGPFLQLKIATSWQLQLRVRLSSAACPSRQTAHKAFPKRCVTTKSAGCIFKHSHTIYLTTYVLDSIRYQHEQLTNINQPFPMTVTSEQKRFRPMACPMRLGRRTAPKLIFCLSSCHPSSSACLRPAQNRSVVAGQSVSKQWISMNLCQHPTHHLPSSTIWLILI